MYRDLCRPLLRRLHTNAVAEVVKTRACDQPLDRRLAKDVLYTFFNADFKVQSLSTVPTTVFRESSPLCTLVN